VGCVECAQGHVEGGGDGESLGCVSRVDLIRIASQQKYIDLLSKGDPNWETHEALKGYTA